MSGNLLGELLELRESFAEQKHPRGHGGKFAKKLGALQKAHPGVQIDVSHRAAGSTLDLIRTKDEHRGKGKARAAMKALVDLADEHGHTLALTPEAVGKGGMNAAQLKRWYAAHGFVPNKGKAKDYAFSQSMIRVPRKK